MARSQEPLLYNGTSDAILQLRLKRGLKQNEAAQRAGVDKGTWSKWERGRQPGREQLQKILKGLGCTEIELWQHAEALEQKHYRQIAINQQIPLPSYTPLAFLRKLDWLQELDLSHFSHEDRSVLERLQRAALDLAMPVEGLFGLAEDFFVQCNRKHAETQNRKQALLV